MKESRGEFAKLLEGASPHLAWHEVNLSSNTKEERDSYVKGVGCKKKGQKRKSYANCTKREVSCIETRLTE